MVLSTSLKEAFSWNLINIFRLALQSVRVVYIFCLINIGFSVSDRATDILAIGGTRQK